MITRQCRQQEPKSNEPGHNQPSISRTQVTRMAVTIQSHATTLPSTSRLAPVKVTARALRPSALKAVVFATTEQRAIVHSSISALSQSPYQARLRQASEDSWTLGIAPSLRKRSMRSVWWVLELGLAALYRRMGDGETEINTGRRNQCNKEITVIDIQRTRMRDKRTVC